MITDYYSSFSSWYPINTAYSEVFNTLDYSIYGIILNKHRLLATSKGHASIRPLLCSMLEHSSVINTWFSTPKTTRNPGHANHVLKTPLCHAICLPPGGSSLLSCLGPWSPCRSSKRPRNLEHATPKVTYKLMEAYLTLDKAILVVISGY